jgi:hypothetical protein
MRYTLTKTMVVISIFGSIASVFLSTKPFNEPYPFFHWKLYSQPLGWQNEFDDFRVYTFDSVTNKFERQAIKVTKTFNEDDCTYLFLNLTNKIIKAENAQQQVDCKQKMVIFLSHVYPNNSKFRVVKETYKPLEIIKQATHYDTTTVFECFRN